ncbi:MAG TPA: hypothetical protein VF350_00410 [Candidatus Bathyarchaeia archaeon]
MEKNSHNKTTITKANALLCPSCCIEFAEVEFDLEFDGVVLHNVKALRCPACQEEVFTPEQVKEIRKSAST